MVLEADAVDSHAVGLHEFDDVLRCGGFGAGGFDGAFELLGI